MIVPVITPPPAPPSPRARELGEQIALFVKDYQNENPDTSAMEIGQALMLARAHLRKELGGGPNLKLVGVALAMGLSMMVAIGVLIMVKQGGSVSNLPASASIIIGIGIFIVLFSIIAIAVAAKKR